MVEVQEEIPAFIRNIKDTNETNGFNFQVFAKNFSKYISFCSTELRTDILREINEIKDEINKTDDISKIKELSECINDSIDNLQSIDYGEKFILNHLESYADNITDNTIHIYEIFEILRIIFDDERSEQFSYIYESCLGIQECLILSINQDFVEKMKQWKR